jgi:hypothetical protein
LGLKATYVLELIHQPCLLSYDAKLTVRVIVRVRGLFAVTKEIKTIKSINQ